MTELLMPEKMKFETPDLTAVNRARLAEIFPGVVADGKVNVDLLRSYVGEEVFSDEVYEFTWVGKKAAIAEAGRPIRKTLRPCLDESKDWDITENLYIEGDNLEVLKLLQESYLGKVKMIYIDPPYNTGNDLIYRDNFTQNYLRYDQESGVYDESGIRLFRNTKANGRFHSDWCNMIYPRLVLARNLLSEDGIIFISIDDYEVACLREMCDEVFGSVSYISTLVWRRRSGANDALNNVSTDHEYVMVYSKCGKSNLNGVIKTFENYTNPDNDPRGPWIRDNLTCGKTASQRPNLFYSITDPNTGIVYQCNPNHVWRFEKKKMHELIDENKVIFPKSSDSLPAYKRHKAEIRSEVKPYSTWLDTRLNAVATKEVRSLMEGQVFDYPKTIDLIYQLLLQGTENESIILDFFSGSATTAHAVMQINADVSGKRKFIMVQLPELCAEDTEAAKEGYKNICEIGKERIRRAGEKIKAEAGLKAQNLDIGFRVFKLDNSNLNNVFFAAGMYSQGMLTRLESNIKPDRTDMDLLFGCILDWGLPLSMPHTHESIDGYTVHTYNDGDLIACFDESISEKAVRKIAERKPLRAVFRDSCFMSSPGKINIFETFKLITPDTEVRVI